MFHSHWAVKKAARLLLPGCVGMLLLSLCLGVEVAAANDKDVDQVRTHVQRRMLSDAGQIDAEEVTWRMGQLSSRGAWVDIDYRDDGATKWKPRKHLRRLMEMAQAWASPSSPLYQDKALQDACILALDHWLVNDYQSKNWWFNELSTPMNLGTIMLLLEPALTPVQKEQGAAILARGWARPDKEDWEANLNQVDRAYIRILHGCLLQDPAMLEEAFAAATFTLARNPQEARETGGIQPDLSFHMHGPLLYTNGYGLKYPEYILAIARFGQGTQWALSEAKKDNLLAFMLDHQRWTVRGDWLDPSTIGRNISRPGADESHPLGEAITLFKTLDPPRSTELEAYAKQLKGQGQGPIGNKHFWNSDYMVHRRSGVLVTVKMASNRTRATEMGNGENLKGTHLSQGAAFVLRNGDEYTGIYPVWDWRRIPGVTAAQDPGPFQQFKWGRGSEGASAFTGGVSDGQHGLAATKFGFEGLTAKKAWWLVDDLLVALGAGISQPEGSLPVVTTLDQRRLAGELQVASPEGGPLRMLPGKDGTAAWAWNGGVGWASLTDAPLLVRDRGQVGTWKAINQRQDGDPQKERVLTLWVDHGVAPKEARYAYLVGLDHSAQAFAALASSPPVSILANTPTLQAIAYPKKGMAGAVFYTPGTVDLDSLHNGLAITASQPCLAQFAIGKGSITVSVANPLNTPMITEFTIPLQLRGEGAAKEMVTWEAGRGVSVLRVPLPEAEQAGASRTATFALP